MEKNGQRFGRWARAHRRDMVTDLGIWNHIQCCLKIPFGFATAAASRATYSLPSSPMTDPDQIRRTLLLVVSAPVEGVRVVTAYHCRRSGANSTWNQGNSEVPTLLFPLFGRKEKPLRPN